MYSMYDLLIHYAMHNTEVSTALRIHNLGTRWRWPIDFMLQPPFPSRHSSVPNSIGYWWALWSRHEHGPEDKHHLLLPRIEPHSSHGSLWLHWITKVKDKGTTPGLAVRTCGRVGSAACVLNLGRIRRGVGCIPQQFSPRRKIRRHPVCRWQVPQPVWEWWRKAQIVPLTGIEPYSISQRSHYIRCSLPAPVYCAATTNERMHANQYNICTYMYTVSKETRIGCTRKDF